MRIIKHMINKKDGPGLACITAKTSYDFFGLGGTTHVIYEPLELMERLAALVPPPRFNITRFYGIFAPAASLRPRVIPEAEASSPPRHPGCQSGVEAPATDPGKTKNKRCCQPRNYPWATLMERVFELDVLACPVAAGG